MVKSSDILRDKSLGGLAWRYLAPFGHHVDFLVTSVFISMTLDGVLLFSRIKTYEIHVNASITVKVVGGISSCNGRKLEKSEGYNCFFVVSCVLESNRFLLTSDLLPNISLVVGQSSVNISLALRARDISTSWLTSNQWYIGQQITVSLC